MRKIRMWSDNEEPPGKILDFIMYTASYHLTGALVDTSKPFDGFSDDVLKAIYEAKKVKEEPITA